MENEVELASEMLHSPVHEFFQVGDTGCVGHDYRGIALPSLIIDGTQTKCQGSVCEHYFRAFSHGSLSGFPGYGHIIQCSENDTFFPLQYSHIILVLLVDSPMPHSGGRYSKVVRSRWPWIQ